MGDLVQNSDSHSIDDLQKYAWTEEIHILKNALKSVNSGYVLFEYTIPRMGKRIDAVILIAGIAFLLEFKVGSSDYTRAAINQITDYALDLKNFHKESQSHLLVPILIASKANDHEYLCQEIKPGILNVIKCNGQNLGEILERIVLNYQYDNPEPKVWIDSGYTPTPTIIEAAQVLYQGHQVADISRNDASAINMNQTTDAINQIIEKSKKEGKKSICFITGVPGAGKTLAGLNIANQRHNFDINEHAIFLSGNFPLVQVLQEALARDEFEREKTRKPEVLAKAKAFIQMVHHFRDDAISTEEAPIEKVIIFDEAQRAWTKEALGNFMLRKKGKANFNMSEPEFLIRVMDRHADWAVIICLIGGGQEINTGEAGLIEWFDALKRDFPNWEVYLSDKISDNEYTRGLSVSDLLKGLRYSVVESLHLAVSLRSFRSEKVSEFIKTLLDVDIEAARSLYLMIHEDYPIYLTRDLEKAKKWVKEQAKGTERFGIIASSGARRLRSFGIWVQSKIDATKWFLNDEEDVRSAYFLEETATEFDIQGLELDWTIVCWDADLRFNKKEFGSFKFNGSKWMKINKEENILYLKNAYRVLLTRARQGMIIFIPVGNDEDKTRKIEFYDGTYRYLKCIGIQEI